MDMDDVMQLRSCSIKSSLNHSPHWIVWQIWYLLEPMDVFGCWREHVEQKSSNGICICRNLPKRRSLELLLWWHCKELRSLQSFTVALHQAAHLQQWKTPRLDAACMPEAWPEISIEVSWQAAEEASCFHISCIQQQVLQRTGLCWYWYWASSRNQRNEMKGFQCLGVIWSSRKRSDCYQVMLVCWYNVSRI